MTNLPRTYFRHDASAATDERCSTLIARTGFEGYGMFWFIAEKMHQSSTGKLDAKLLDGLAWEMGVELAKLKQVLGVCYSIGLFVLEGDTYYSNRMQRERAAFSDVIEKRKEAGRKGGLAKAKKIPLANAKQRLSKSLAEERRGEEIRGMDNVRVPRELPADADSARMLSAALRKTNPAYRQKFETDDPRRIDSWAREFRKMREIDNATPEQIQLVIRWIFDGNSRDANFWKPNIQSAVKLREKFQQIIAQMQREQTVHKPVVVIR